MLYVLTEGIAVDAVVWIVLIVVVIGVVGWLVNRRRSNNSGGTAPGDATRTPADRSAGTSARTDAATGSSQRTDGALSGGSAAASAAAAGTTGMASAAGFGRPAEPPAPATAEEPAETPTPAPATSETAAPAPAAHSASGETRYDEARDERRRQDEAEWETQWSEAGGTGAAGRPAPTPPAAAAAEAAPAPVHHAEYTDQHAPTLPGAESAAVEEADDDGAPAPEASGTRGGAAVPEGAAAAETADRAESSALVENGADHRGPVPETQVQGNQDQGNQVQGTEPEPLGHLAADEPYGTGSAAAGPDGGGPAGYTVKGDAGAMVYYEEGHPDFDQTRAEVWFESAAHAEAAGFRAPRRRRL